MLDLLFLLFYVSLPFWIFFLLKIAGEKTNKVTIVTITTLALYLFSVVGVLPLFYHFDEYRYNTGVQDKILILKMLLYSGLNLSFFLFGVVFVRKIVRLRPIAFNSSECRDISKLQRLILVFLFCLCVFVLIKYISQLDRIAIIVALTEGANEANLVRSDMGNAFPGNYHWYRLVMQDIGSFLTFVFLSIWLVRRRRSDFLLLLLSFSYSVIVCVLATEKAPLAWLIVGMLIVNIFIKNNGYVSPRKIALFFVLIVALLVLMYIYFMGVRDVGSALWSVFSRTFAGSINSAYFYLEYFPKQHEYLFGRTFPNPGGVLPYEPYPYTIEIMNWRFPSLIGSGVVGSAPTVFWGEAYANFGPFGVPLVASFMGCYLAVIGYLVSKIEINPLSIGFYVWLMLFFKDLSVTGFSGYFYSIYVLGMTFIFLVLLLIRGKLRFRIQANIVSS